MVFMGQQGSGIEKITIWQLISCPDCLDVFAAPGGEHLMVDRKIYDGDLIRSFPIIFNNILFCLVRDRYDIVRRYCAQIYDGSQEEQMKAGKITWLVNVLKIENNEDRSCRAEERGSHPR